MPRLVTIFNPVIHGRKKNWCKTPSIYNVIVMNINLILLEPIWSIKVLRRSLIKQDVSVKFILHSSPQDAVGSLSVVEVHVVFELLT